MARPVLVRSPATNNGVGANADLRYVIGLAYPIRALHWIGKTVAGVALTEAESEADIALFFVEMNGVRIFECTPARMNDLHRFYRQALGGNVTDDGRYTFKPHRPHLRDEVVLTKEGGLALEGRKSLEWGTGGLDQMVFGLTLVAAPATLSQTELMVEYDADDRRKNEPPGEIYRLRQLPQSGLGTGWTNIQSLWKAGTRYQQLLALHVLLDSGVFDVREGCQFKIGGVPIFYTNPNCFVRINRDGTRTPISGYQHIDFQALGDDLISSCPKIGKDDGVTNFSAEINYSTAPTGNDNVILVEDIVRFDEIQAA